jgi:hypothetical protein
VAGIGTTIAMHKIPEYARFNEFQPVVIVWVVSTAVVDTVIAGSLVFYVVCLPVLCIHYRMLIHFAGEEDVLQGDSWFTVLRGYDQSVFLWLLGAHCTE